MANVFKEFVKGILLRGETSDPTDNKSGSLWHNLTSGRIKSYIEGAVRTVVSEDQTQTLTNKTVDADNNTISNLENDNIKVGANISRDKLAPGNTNVVVVTDNSGNIVDSAITTSELSKLASLSGDIVTTTATQVITNKDYDGATASNSSRVTLPKNTRTNLNALTRKQGTLVYDTTNNYPLYDDGSALVEFGGGAGGDEGYGVMLQSDATFSVQASGEQVAGSFDPSPPDLSGSTLQSSSDWIGNTFLATATGNLVKVEFRTELLNGTISGTIAAQLYSVAAGLPDTLLATSDPIDATTLVVGWNDLIFSFNGTQLVSSGTSYAVILNTTNTVGLGIAGNPKLALEAQGSNPYADGTSVYTVDGGSSWAQEVSIDHQFIVTVTDDNVVDLSFNDDINLEIKGLEYADNVIQTSESPITFNNPNEVAYVTPNTVGGGPALTVTVDDLENVPESAVIIARRSDDDIIVATTRLAIDESAKVYSVPQIPIPLSQLEVDLIEANKFLTRNASGEVVSSIDTPVSSVVGVLDAQTLTNKDIDGGTASNSNRITLPKNTNANLTALTRKQGTVVYDTTNDSLLYDDGTNLNEINYGQAIVCKLSNTSGQSLSGATKITGWTVIEDSESAFNLVNSEYVIPEDGQYCIAATFLFSSVGITTGGAHPTVYFRVNSTQVYRAEGSAYVLAGENVGVTGTTILPNLVAGDIVDVQVSIANGGSRSLTTVAIQNQFSIFRIK